MKDFRPISLLGGGRGRGEGLVVVVYKWLVKVLANKIKVCLPKVISRAQNAFLEGRKILDVALVANGTFDLIVRGNGRVVLCKLDLEKAYDHVDWSFLSIV